ncbi:hypothetical protein SELMODRAFT_439728 [Selaginella moellendorffii]|uniref:Uncharacterized protein n=1 Tax=Selaginella moellendorffii TaxID=88036 RepID=D8R6T6_SELML|nr:hypothetical protein SELMODRAFT_439728 [Selaginella moellendorffii]
MSFRPIVPNSRQTINVQTRDINDSLAVHESSLESFPKVGILLDSVLELVADGSLVEPPLSILLLLLRRSSITSRDLLEFHHHSAKMSCIVKDRSTNLHRALHRKHHHVVRLELINWKAWILDEDARHALDVPGLWVALPAVGMIRLANRVIPVDAIVEADRFGRRQDGDLDLFLVSHHALVLQWWIREHQHVLARGGATVAAHGGGEARAIGLHQGGQALVVVIARLVVTLHKVQASHHLGDPGLHHVANLLWFRDGELQLLDIRPQALDVAPVRLQLPRPRNLGSLLLGHEILLVALPDVILDGGVISRAASARDDERLLVAATVTQVGLVLEQRGNGVKGEHRVAVGTWD